MAIIMIKYFCIPCIFQLIFKIKHDKKIITQINDILTVLNLPPIDIKFRFDYNNAHFTVHPNNTKELVFGLNYLLNASPQHRIHTVCHEIAHYFQYYKHLKWFRFFEVEYKKANLTYITLQNYQQLKLEQNAEKLARLFQKLCKEKEINN